MRSGDPEASDGPRRRVVVLEVIGGGHRLAYVRRIVMAAVDSGSSVTLVTTAAMRLDHSGEWSAHLRDVEHLFTSVVPPQRPPTPRALLRSALDEGDLLCIPDGDLWISPLLKEAVVRRRRDVRLLVMRPYPPAGGLPRLRFIGKRLLVGALHLVGRRVRIGVLQAPGAPPPPALGGSVTVSDPPLAEAPLPDRDLVRRDLNVDGAVVVSILGVVGRRKNPELVLDALELLAGTHPVEDWVLHLPGEVEPGLAEHLGDRARAVRVLFGPGYLDAPAYAAALASSDVVAVIHDNEGSSGVLNDVAAHGVRAVAGGVASVCAQGAAVGAVVLEETTARAVADALLIARASRGTAPAGPPGGAVLLEEFFLR